MDVEVLKHEYEIFTIIDKYKLRQEQLVFIDLAKVIITELAVLIHGKNLKNII
ncbi:MAG: hypothetical protein H7263_17000 [Candidatus Sericytochromatia bacterium]|nr:hypothetical protein [Candidatus Sericytochromatia bacterium]